MDKKIILYVIAIILVFGLIIFTFFPGLIYTIKDSANSGTDKCATPEGYTEEEWKEHMSHHPNIYAECLT